MRFLRLGRSVGRIEKKKPKKKNHKKSRNSRPWYPRTTLKVNIHIFGLTKCTIFFFSENAKIWVGRTALDGEKREYGLGRRKKATFAGFSETDSRKFSVPTSPKNNRQKPAAFGEIFWANLARNKLILH